MKKFFKDDSADDASRSSLFGRKKSPNPKSENPYAQEPANDPYMAPQHQQQPPQSRPGGLPSGPRAGRAGVGLPSGPSPRANMDTPPPPYQPQPSPQPQQRNQGYGSDRYGASGGYGSNRYGDDRAGGYGSGSSDRQGGSSSMSSSARGPGGYGGLGDTSEDKNALFGGGRDRYVAHQTNNANGRGAYGSAAPEQGSGSASGSGTSSGYNKYGGGYGEERELSEQERIKLEERDLARQIDAERDATVDTGHRILGIINSTIETANSSMQNMAQQDERLRSTERNLDLAHVHNRTAQERTKELKHYNRSLWNPGNPFMSKSKAAEREAKLLQQHQEDRERVAAMNKDAYDSKQKYEHDLKNIERDMNNRKALGLSSSQQAASTNKFVFDESDEEDDNPENIGLRADRRAKEAEINDVIMPQMAAGVSALNNIAQSFGGRIEESNQLIRRIGEKTDVVDDGVRMNRAKLDDIYRRG